MRITKGKADTFNGLVNIDDIGKVIKDSTPFSPKRHYCKIQFFVPKSMQFKCILFNGWVIFHCVYAPYLFYPFICWWTSRLLPCPGYYKQCCDEHWGTRVSFPSGFLSVYAQQYETSCQSRFDAWYWMLGAGACWLSLVVKSGSYASLQCMGFSSQYLLLLQSNKTLGCRLSSGGTRPWLPHGMCDLLRPGIEPMSLALQGGFLTTDHEENPIFYFIKNIFY